MVTTTEDKIAYCNCMEQIKRRLRLLASITSGVLKTGDEGSDAEFACLQLRKALELIAFATLAANRARYAEVRAGVEKEWSAKRILDRLAQVNPDFYPVPLIPVPQGPGRWHFDVVADGFLTQKEFTELFDKCSDVVHEWNPFRAQPRLVDFGRSLSEWACRIHRLLETHQVRLVNEADILVVRLTDPADGKAHVFTASPQAG